MDLLPKNKNQINLLSKNSPYLDFSMEKLNNRTNKGRADSGDLFNSQKITNLINIRD